MQWFRLYSDVLNSPKVQTLSPDIFKVWINCLCIACNKDETFQGTLHETIVETAYALRLPVSETQEALDSLVAADLLYIEDGLYHIVNWDKRQFKSDTSTERVKSFRDKKKKQKCNVSGNVSVTPPDTEQKQIQNRTESEEEALSLYNQFADANGFARVQKLTVTRKGKLQARLKDCGGIEGWHTALQKMAQSNFCRGSNDRGWRADFDFLVTEGSFVKLMEGKYDNNKPEDKFKSQVKELAQNGW